jgi:hypothetical protein
MFVVALVGLMGGSSGNAWIILKTIVLFIAMMVSFVLATGLDKQRRRDIVLRAHKINERPEPFSRYTTKELWTDEHTSAK